MMDGGGSAGWARMIEAAITEMRADIKALRDWRNYVLGAAFVIGILSGVYAKQVAVVLRQVFP